MTRVLVVDDEIDTLNLLQTILEISGYQAFTTLNSIDAITLAEVEHPDCILLDIMMPQLDGFTLCKMMRMHPTTKNLPIVFVTAYSALDLEDRRVDAGADMVLPKPIGMDALIEAIEKATAVRLAKANEGTAVVPAPAPTASAPIPSPATAVTDSSKATQQMAVVSSAPSPAPATNAPAQPVVPAASSDETSFEIKPDLPPASTMATQTAEIVPPPLTETTNATNDKNATPAVDKSQESKPATEPTGITSPAPVPNQPEKKTP